MEDQAQAIQRMRGLIYGNWQTCVTCAFAELGIADLLDGAAMSVVDLAQRTGTHADSLYRFLRCCVQLQFVRVDADTRTFALTPFGALLRSDHPFGQRDAARLNGASYRYQPWGRLVDILRAGSGEGFSETHGEGSLDFLKGKPELLEVFQRAMSNLSTTEDESIARAYEFGRFRHVVDIGGGHGNFVKAILRSHPGLRGTLFDLGASLDSIGAEPCGVDDRLARVAGDFFLSVPADGDVYTLKNVLHNWPEDRAGQILRSVRAAVCADGDAARKRVLVIEHLMVEDGESTPSVAPWLDLNFFILVGGRDRTRAEYESLFERAGFSISRLLPTATGRTIIELAVA
jgi:hypothetical protein